MSCSAMGDFHTQCHWVPLAARTFFRLNFQQTSLHPIAHSPSLSTTFSSVHLYSRTPLPSPYPSWHSPPPSHMHLCPSFPLDRQSPAPFPKPPSLSLPLPLPLPLTLSSPAAASRKAWFTSSAKVFFSVWMTRSTMETLGVGTRRAMPLSLPLSWRESEDKQEGRGKKRHVSSMKQAYWRCQAEGAHVGGGHTQCHSACAQAREKEMKQGGGQRGSSSK